MDELVHFDPSSISLFSANVLSVDDQSSSSVAEERPLSSESQLAAQKSIGTDQTEHGETDGRFSTYHRRKNMEVVHRRNLIERLDKLKASHEAFFTVPQLKAVSNNQLSLFLRRLLKSADIKQHISTELLERILLLEESNENASDTAKMAFRTEAELSQFADRLTCNGKSETHLNLDQQTDEDDELTDEEVTEFEDDDNIFGPSDEFTVELHDLLEQEVQILTADKRAATAQTELRRLIEFGEKELDKIEMAEGQCVFEQPMQNDDQLGEGQRPTENSARCRAFLSGPRRAVIRRDFDNSLKKQRKSRPIIPNKRCGTEQYAFADCSIHSELSLPSAVPLDAQIMKYLHVADFIPVEIEMRRFKTYQTALKSQEQLNELKHAFYNLEEDFHEDDDRFGTTEAKGIKISLPFRKMLKKRSVIVDQNAEQTDTESDPEDYEYDADPSSPREMCKFKRRRMTYSSGTAKPPKLENRRTSHVEFGSSMFDYDAQVMDIGLPLPTIQKVENVEIVIPSFRKKCGLLSDFSLSTTECERCRLAEEWEETWRLHAELEQQEKNLRFRPPLGSNVPRKPMTHPPEN
ncbi:hypothetical protein niasHT_022532 [Heterodera trifolii]|uniref:Uncharacterized protein n=1 Tax=Heterodera trifolii TaxID=157864 RepID=A0ABD2JR81_9BILA